MKLIKGEHIEIFDADKLEERLREGDSNVQLTEIGDYILEKYDNETFVSNYIALYGKEKYWNNKDLIEPLMQFFTHDILHLCACGNPDWTFDIIRKLLNIRYDWYINVQKEYPDWNMAKKRYKEDLNIDFKDEDQWGVLQFMMYILDYNDILDHGSSISGAFLTPLGEMYRIVLNAWYESDEEMDI